MIESKCTDGYCRPPPDVTLDRTLPPLEALSLESLDIFCQKLIQVTFPSPDMRGQDLLSKHIDRANVSFT